MKTVETKTNKVNEAKFKSLKDARKYIKTITSKNKDFRSETYLNSEDYFIDPNGNRPQYLIGLYGNDSVGYAFTVETNKKKKNGGVVTKYTKTLFSKDGNFIIERHNEFEM